MNAGKTFTEILANRGRVVLFTPNAAVGLRFEQHAERHHARVVCTRGWADPYGPLGIWKRVHAAREYAVFSCDQKTYLDPFFILECTDFVWVGDLGQQLREPHLALAWNRAGEKARLVGATPWVMGEDDL